ncbi:MAG: hypothetical protein NTY03_08190 [Candidatus Bathyarchaeota archaeon]|nr:hypothetical protein [Candidatus Bathyarchaeota archaeon]
MREDRVRGQPEYTETLTMGLSRTLVGIIPRTSHINPPIATAIPMPLR